MLNPVLQVGPSPRPPPSCQGVVRGSLPLDSLTSLVWSMATVAAVHIHLQISPFLPPALQEPPLFPPFLPHPPSQRGKDATDAPNEALVTFPLQPCGGGYFKTGP